MDGTGIPRYKADLAVKDGRIATISGRVAPGGAREIDASGCIVAPGAIDLHTHYDAQLNWDPYASLSGWFGVTSLTIGECGFWVRTHQAGGPGPEHADDGPHRGDTPGIHAQGAAVGLGDLPRVTWTAWTARGWGSTWVAWCPSRPCVATCWA